MNLKAGNRTITLFKKGGYYCLDKRYIDTMMYTMYIHKANHNAGTKLVLI